MQYESAENTIANVEEQKSMFNIVRLFVKFSELRKIFNNWSIVFFGLRKFLIYWDLEKFHALQNLENKWKLWTLKKIQGSSGLWKKFKEALDIENFWVVKLAYNCFGIHRRSIHFQHHENVTCTYIITTISNLLGW